uniref:LAGLIDADG homing endonuclease n=1 Tax=Cyathus striatus TaxID=68777 RepID=UPI0023F1DCC8|nr:LAGLIDADG homing endonuclease [Cyathus striatus]WDS46395.1 LAGLIDADG homing endonuclease [Cyathus striatus]WDS46430.1 LAGLIDADG homing endonuclease [Cyathus striatus]
MYIIIIFLNSNYLDLNFKTEILVFDPIFLMALPLIPKKRKRGYMPKEEKIRVSNNIPDWFKQVVCGLMLSDATIRMNGSQALMSIQQTHQELTQEIWKFCFHLNLVLSGIHIINRTNRKPVYSFQTLSLSFFTSLYNDWYKSIGNKNYKVLPLNLDSLFTPLAFAFLIMGDGSWDKSCSRLILHMNNFTLIEVNRFQSILLSKFNISSYTVKSPHSEKDRGYIIKIPAREVSKVRELVSDHIYPTLKYKIGL